MRQRLLVAAAAFGLLIAFGATAVSAQTGSNGFQVAGGVEREDTVDVAKSLTGRLAQTDPSLLGRTSSRMINVIVKLDYDPAAVYSGGLAGLKATSPSVTGRSLDRNAAAVRTYQTYVEDFEARARRAIDARIPSAQIGQSFQLAYGGLSLRLPANQVDRLLETPGVAAVQSDRLEQPLAVQEPYQFIGAEAVWPSLGGTDLAGRGVLVANIDTGIWPESPMLEDRGLPAPPSTYGCQFHLSGDVNDAAFACNHKVVGAYAFTDTYTTVFGALPGEFCVNTPGPGPWLCSARDADGHGTHTITTAAGDFVQSAPMFGMDRGPTSGMAPGAWVIGYRVCLQQGCFPSDSIAAVSQAIADGVDVLNFSISGGNNAYADAVELAFLSAYGAGILVNASAGNAGPGPGTANHAGPWVNTVSASYPPRIYQADLHLEAPGGGTLDATGVTITPPIDIATEVVLPGSVPGYTGGARCNVPFPAGTLSGKIVLCNRDLVGGRAAAGFRALAGGAAGMILVNNGHQDLFTDLHWLPVIMLDDGTWQGQEQPGTDVRDFVVANPGLTATFTTGEATEQVPDIMTTFSSRGPLGDWIKPDVTAPGIEILAGRSPHPHPAAIPSGPPGDDFMAIAGTSMSSPHAAGVSALRQGCPPGLDTRADQVRAHDVLGAERAPAGRRDAGGSVQHRGGVDPSGSSGRSGRRIRRDGGELRCARRRPDPSDRCEPPEHQRADVRRERHDGADVHERERRIPAAHRHDFRPRGCVDLGQPIEVRDGSRPDEDAHVHHHGRRAGPEHAVFRVDQTRLQGCGRQRRLHPGGVLHAPG
jgi:hypothetical protein